MRCGGIIGWLLLAGWLVGGAATVLAQTGTNVAAVVQAGETNLPVIFLEAKDRIVSQVKVPCTLRLVEPPGVGRGVTGLMTGVVRIHGASSQAFQKKSLSFTLDQPAPLLDLRASSHWVLNAAYIDRSLMRHKLAYDLFRSLSTGQVKRYAAGSRFVEVQVNGKYNGVYLLMERVDRQLMELRAFNSNEVSHACIYKAVDHGANFGGGGHGGYEQREPDIERGAWWQPLDEFNRFVSSAKDEEFFHPQTGIGARLDLDSAIDFHLLVLLTSNQDGITKNFFLARNQPDGSRFFFAPWDYDGTFGRNWDMHRYPTSAWHSNHLFERLRVDSAYRGKFAARWNYLRDHEFSAATIHALIDANARTLGESVRRNVARWPTTQGPYPDQLTFEEDLAQMKEWVQERIKWLDEHINREFGPSAK